MLNTCKSVTEKLCACKPLFIPVFLCHVAFRYPLARPRAQFVHDTLKAGKRKDFLLQMFGDWLQGVLPLIRIKPVKAAL